MDGNKQWRHQKRHRWHPERHQEELYLRFVTCCVTCVTKKREPKPQSPNEFSHLTPKNFQKILQLLLFLFVGPAKPLWSLALVQPLTMAYKYRCLALNCKTPRRSLLQLDETRRRIKKFYNYCSQSAAHQSSFKVFFKNLVRYLWSVFPCRLSGYTFRRDVGGQRHQHN